MPEITKTIPNYNPADANSLSGLAKVLSSSIMKNSGNALPAIIQSYDRKTNRAVVKPAITGVASMGQKVSKEPLIDIPVFCMAGGGIVLSFPVKQGDTGWIIASDRNISLFKQNLTESAPNDFRFHSFSDGFFFPDKINDISISDDDNDAFVLQTLTGTSKVTLKENNIALSTNSGTNNIILNENIISANSTEFNIVSNVSITGTNTISGVTTSAGLVDTTAVSGTFVSKDDKTIKVENGIIKSIS